MAKEAAAYTLLKQIEESIDKGHYSNALAATHDLAKALHLLWAGVVRYEMKLKSQEEKGIDAELLAACKAALEDGGDYKLSGHVKRCLREVIAQAEGATNDQTLSR